MWFNIHSTDLQMIYAIVLADMRLSNSDHTLHHLRHIFLSANLWQFLSFKMAKLFLLASLHKAFLDFKILQLAFIVFLLHTSFEYAFSCLPLFLIMLVVSI